MYDRNFKVKIGDVESNTLDTMLWLRGVSVSENIPYIIAVLREKQGFDGFNLTSGEIDPDTAATIAVTSVLPQAAGSCVYDEAGDVYTVTVTADAICEAVGYVFGIDDFDYKSMKGYSPEDPDNVKVIFYPDESVYGEVDGNITDDGYVLVLRPDGGQDYAQAVASFTKDLTLIKIVFEGTTNPPVPLPGDVDGDSFLTVKDILLIRKAIAGIFEFSKYAGRAADVNRDGYIDMKDVLAIMRNISE